MRKFETKLFDVPSFITGGVDREEIGSDHHRSGFDTLPSTFNSYRHYHNPGAYMMMIVALWGGGNEL